METVNIERVESKKKADSIGIYHKDIATRKHGFNNFSLQLALMGEGQRGLLHSHSDNEHVLLVIEGELEVFNAGEVHSVPPGTALLIHPGEEHEVVNVYPGTTKYYVIYSPPK